MLLRCQQFAPPCRDSTYRERQAGCCGDENSSSFTINAVSLTTIRVCALTANNCFRMSLTQGLTQAPTLQRLQRYTATTEGDIQSTASSAETLATLEGDVKPSIVRQTPDAVDTDSEYDIIYLSPSNVVSPAQSVGDRDPDELGGGHKRTPHAVVEANETTDEEDILDELKEIRLRRKLRRLRKAKARALRRTG